MAHIKIMAQSGFIRFKKQKVMETPERTYEHVLKVV